MKALVLKEQNSLIIKDCPVPSAGEGELLIKTKAATICTSDLNDIKYNTFGISLPMIMGHEGAGIVAAVGKGVSNFQVGDEVATHPVMPCGKCISCKRGLEHLCDNMDHLGINRSGVFAEYYVIRQDRARKKPEKMSFALSSLMEPVCVCIEAIERANVKDGNNVLIIGDGPFGIIIAKLVQSYNPGKVILLGHHPFRMNFAVHATKVNESETSDSLKSILNATNGEGIDSAILCVGSSKAVDTAIAALRSRGTISVFSAVTPAPKIDLFKVHVKELNICGSCNDMGYLDRAINYLSDPTLGLDKIITHEITFDRWQEAIQLADQGKDEAIKVSMLFD